ncbi:hypothetical protein A6A28_13630 [Streptomyces sp. CB03578]|nr:hypothetical protein A6A28_13630 [Streptomyces sp. CB03578]
MERGTGRSVNAPRNKDFWGFQDLLDFRDFLSHLPDQPARRDAARPGLVAPGQGPVRIGSGTVREPSRGPRPRAPRRRMEVHGRGARTEADHEDPAT